GMASGSNLRFAFICRTYGTILCISSFTPRNKFRGYAIGRAHGTIKCRRHDRLRNPGFQPWDSKHDRYKCDRIIMKIVSKFNLYANLSVEPISKGINSRATQSTVPYPGQILRLPTISFQL